jgi:hypothetical protein
MYQDNPRKPPGWRKTEGASDCPVEPGTIADVNSDVGEENLGMCTPAGNCDQENREAQCGNTQGVTAETGETTGLQHDYLLNQQIGLRSSCEDNDSFEKVQKKRKKIS